jgi:hypothetical protein
MISSTRRPGRIFCCDTPQGLKSRGFSESSPSNLPGVGWTTHPPLAHSSSRSTILALATSSVLPSGRFPAGTRTTARFSWCVSPHGPTDPPAARTDKRAGTETAARRALIIICSALAPGVSFIGEGHRVETRTRNPPHHGRSSGEACGGFYPVKADWYRIRERQAAGKDR